MLKYSRERKKERKWGIKFNLNVNNEIVKCVEFEGWEKVCMVCF